MDSVYRHLKQIKYRYSETSPVSSTSRWYIHHRLNRIIDDNPNINIEIEHDANDMPSLIASWKTGEEYTYYIGGWHADRIGELIKILINSKTAGNTLIYSAKLKHSSNPSIQGVWEPSQSLQKNQVLSYINKLRSDSALEYSQKSLELSSQNRNQNLTRLGRVYDSGHEPLSCLRALSIISRLAARQSSRILMR